MVIRHNYEVLIFFDSKYCCHIFHSFSFGIITVYSPEAGFVKKNKKNGPAEASP
jgi:hypothetical protein